MNRQIEKSAILARLNKYASGDIYGAGVIARRMETIKQDHAAGCGIGVHNDGTPRPLNWLYSDVHRRDRVPYYLNLKYMNE